MIRIFFILAALLPFGGGAALACTEEGGRIAAEARDDRRGELRRVRGAYNVLAVTRRSEVRFGQTVEVATYQGRITTRSGRAFDTLHEDDGSIILCAMFEKPVADLEGQIQELKRLGEGENGVSTADEVEALEAKARDALKSLYAKLTPWQKTQVARHPERPHFRDYIAGLIEDPVRRVAMALAARRRIETEFPLVRMIDGYERALGETIGA